MIVCSVRKNDCHSERSEEPPHFAFALAVVLAFVFIRSRQESSSRPEAAHFAAAVERPPHFAVVVVLVFAVVCSFDPPTQQPSFRPKRPTVSSWAAQWRNLLLYHGPHKPP